MIQPGVLFFGNNLKSASPKSKPSQGVVNDEQSKINQQILSNLAVFKTEVYRLNSKISQLEIQSEISQKAYQREKQKWFSEKQTLNEQLGEIAKLKSQLSNFKTKVVNSLDKYNQDLVEDKQERLFYKEIIEKQLQKVISPFNSNSAKSQDNHLADPNSVIVENELYNQTSTKRIDPQSNTEIKANSNGSYQSFYHLIKRGELEVTKVTIPQETMEKIRHGTQSEFKFVDDRKGKYWVVNWQDVYYLIPEENANINPYQYGDFQRVFNCQDYQKAYLDFEVIEPATIINCDRETWRLERKGKIKFISDNDQKSEEVKNKNSQDSKINFKTKISQFRQAYTQVEKSKVKSQKSKVKLKVNKKLIYDLIVAKVAISVETLEQITFYKPDTVILENTPHGKYWIIDYLGNYFLIPSEIEQITNAKETSLTVAKLLFHLSGYYPEYSSYHLIKPAIVSKLSKNQWKLEEKGKFNFS